MGWEEGDLIELPAGTVIHVEGIPFALPDPTRVRGREANLALISVAARVVPPLERLPKTLEG